MKLGNGNGIVRSTGRSVGQLSEADVKPAYGGRAELFGDAYRSGISPGATGKAPAISILKAVNWSTSTTGSGAESAGRTGPAFTAADAVPTPMKRPDKLPEIHHGQVGLHLPVAA